jgi:hypothetical protein
MLQLFIYDCLALYLFSIYLNSISTNYNMILTNLTNQSVAIFFAIFPHLNAGIHASIPITILSLAFNILSVVLWINAEKAQDIQSEGMEIRDYQQIEEIKE